MTSYIYTCRQESCSYSKHFLFPPEKENQTKTQLIYICKIPNFYFLFLFIVSASKSQASDENKCPCQSIHKASNIVLYILICNDKENKREEKTGKGRYICSKCLREMSFPKSCKDLLFRRSSKKGCSSTANTCQLRLIWYSIESLICINRILATSICI